MLAHGGSQGTGTCKSLLRSESVSLSVSFATGWPLAITFATQKNLSYLDALNDAMVHRRSNIAPQPALLSQQPYLPGNGGAVSENRANFVDIEKGRLFPTTRASEADGAARLSVEGVVDGADRQICEECKKVGARDSRQTRTLVLVVG